MLTDLEIKIFIQQVAYERLITTEESSKQICLEGERYFVIIDGFTCIADLIINTWVSKIEINNDTGLPKMDTLSLKFEDKQDAVCFKETVKQGVREYVTNINYTKGFPMPDCLKR